MALMGFHKLSILGQLTKICLIGKLTNRVTDNIKSNFFSSYQIKSMSRISVVNFTQNRQQ